MVKRRLMLAALALWSAAAASAQAKAQALPFAEVWAYLMQGEEAYLASAGSVSDLCYFSAEINSYGELVGVPDIARLAAWKGRKHLVVAELGSHSLTHFCLDPRYGIRDTLLDDIMRAAEPYDGLQLDFEAIPARDRELFVEFLSLLKGRLGSRILSVALPARLSESQDSLGYARIAGIVDRVFIMAYDEHWSTSAPGPVASMDWCRSVAQYALTQMNGVKLVMGLPFYGRSWIDKRLAKAFKYSGVASLIEEENGGCVFSRKDGVPSFTYKETVTVTVYYDDAASTAARLGLYKDAGVSCVGFWRLGQEDPLVWDGLRLYSVP